MIPTVFEDDYVIDWSKLGQTPQTAPPIQPPEKSLPTFHNQPRTYEWQNGKMVPK